ASRCSTSRTSGCTTRRRSRGGSSATSRTSRPCDRCSTRRSCVPGGCTRRARSPRSCTATCSCPTCSSPVPATTRPVGRASTFMAAVESPRAAYEQKKAQLLGSWRGSAKGQLRLAKSTVSNLFRYQPRRGEGQRVSLAAFDGVLHVDPAARTAEVEGLATYSTVVHRCLEHGLLPLVAPELKHITVGGATVGIGIESTCFRYGFVHDGLIEADVLLPSGRVVTARADNEHADLFHA